LFFSLSTYIYVQQKTEDMLKQNEKLKADNAELEKKLAYANGKLDQLKEDMEKDRENVRTLQVNMDKQCNEINKQLRQLVRLRFLFLHTKISFCTH